MDQLPLKKRVGYVPDIVAAEISWKIRFLPGCTAEDHCGTSRREPEEQEYPGRDAQDHPALHRQPSNPPLCLLRDSPLPLSLAGQWGGSVWAQGHTRTRLAELGFAARPCLP